VILLVGLLLREVMRRYRREAALEEQAAVVSTLLDVTPAAIAVKDEKGRYLLINEAMERQFGRKRSEIIGPTTADLMPPETVPQIVGWDVAARQATNQLLTGER